MKYVLRYNEVKEKILDELDSLRTQYNGADLEANKISLIQRASDNLADKCILDEDGNDRTKEFIEGLHNIITDPNSRELIYQFEPCEMDDLKSHFRYQNRPDQMRGTPFKIIFTPQNVEVGRCLIDTVRNEVVIQYIEIADDFKKQVLISRVLKDCILAEYGTKVNLSYGDKFQGVPMYRENVVEESRRKALTE